MYYQDGGVLFSYLFYSTPKLNVFNVNGYSLSMVDNSQ